MLAHLSSFRKLGVHASLVHLDDERDRAGRIVPRRGSVAPLMVLRRSIRQRLREFERDVLTHRQAELAVGSVGQCEGELTRVVT